MKIVVIGPQRSGSTFVSHCLARSFNAKHIDELEFDVYFLDWFYKIVEESGDSWVAHAPGLFADMFKILEKIPDVTFVIVKRNIKEIQNSEFRIRLNMQHEKNKLFINNNEKMPMAAIKYAYWDKWKKYLPSWVEYDYRDFENHPFWVENEVRRTFKPKQWKVED
jgi:hypothetical protein